MIAAPGRPIAPADRRRIARALRRRAAREPVSRILGRREFWSLDFRVTPATLDPRPDSETLVQAVLDRVGPEDRALDILDLGTGSGCLLLALLHELAASRGLGLDISPGAVRTARVNARTLGLGARARFAEGDFAVAPRGRFDVVVSNPPYLAEGEIAMLEPELGFEPQRALLAGPDGLSAYRIIAARLPELLRSSGLAALEIGASQARAVAELLAKAGLRVEKPVADLAGRDRVLLARLDNNPGAGQKEVGKRRPSL
jgi:release factor glutamine methyltransferase